MPHLTEQHLNALAESHVTAWVTGGTPAGAPIPAGLRFEESGSLFRSDVRRFLDFLRGVADDAAYRFHWAVSRCRHRSVHVRVYLSPVAAGGLSKGATLRLRLHIGEDDSLSALTVIYRPAKLIACLSPNRRTALARRILYTLGLYRIRP